MTFINEGTADRVTRVLMAFAFGYSAWLTWPTTIGMVMLAIAAIALVTGLVGWCPAYAVFGISTRKKAAV